MKFPKENARSYGTCTKCKHTHTVNNGVCEWCGDVKIPRARKVVRQPIEAYASTDE